MISDDAKKIQELGEKIGIPISNEEAEEAVIDLAKIVIANLATRISPTDVAETGRMLAKILKGLKE